MANIQVFGSTRSNEIRVRTRTREVLNQNLEPSGATVGFELLLAAIGVDTNAAIGRCCRNGGWDVENVYLELALHGTAPWQAIGRRIWIDGALAPAEMQTLLTVAERVPVIQSLNPNIPIRTRLEKLRRPDLE